MALLSALFDSAIAFVGPDASLSAIFSTSPSNFPSGKTQFTSPRWRATVASIGSPSITTSIALARPRILVSQKLVPESGASPTLMKAS